LSDEPGNSKRPKRWAHEAVIVGLSALMLGSNHAVQYSHLRHHKYCLGENDIEATCHLPALAKGLDVLAPELQRKRVF